MRQLARLICLLALAAGSAVASAAAAAAAPAGAAAKAASVPASAAAAPATGHITAAPATASAAATSAPAATSPSNPPQSAAAAASATSSAAAAAVDAAPPAAPFEAAPRPPLPAPIVGTPAPTLTPSFSYLQSMLGLAVVLALLLGLAWLAKRFGPRQAHGSANVKLVGALSLGGRERILVVEVGEQWIVVGAAPGRVNALSTMPRQELPADAGAAGPAGAPLSASFADWLKQTMDKRGGNPPAA